MIRSLRRAQPLWASLCAAGGLSLLVAARVTRPEPAAPPASPASAPQASNRAILSGPETRGQAFYAQTSQQLWIELEHSPLAPDLLLYASPGPDLESLRGLPADARCLGSLDDFRWPQRGGPQRDLTTNANLLLYSLGHGRVLAQGRLMALP
jgi:hypothetical protein